ncbi:AarF/ABC1/UbiB kinase family protein [bacterium]|nr:AarF/ABC1/UbiB kinase family protein [bacterium]
MANPGRRTSDHAADAVDAAAAVLAAAAGLIDNLLARVDRLVAEASRDARAVAADAAELWDAVAAGAQGVSHAARGAPRFARVAGEMLRLVAAYRWHAVSGAGDLASLHQRHAERLYALCVELRGGVLKLGQFASSRMDLLPDAYVAALSRLQDRVPAAPLDAILERLAEEHGGDLDRFASFEPQPLAAASLAQVHAATLADGTPVVVKIQLPGIARLVEVDLAALQLVAPALRDQVPSLDLETFAAELSRAVRAELDYRAEAVHAAAFAAAFAADDDLVVPRVHAACSTDRVLVLERIEGARLTDYLDACAARGTAGAADRDRLFAILIRCVCAQVLEHGLLHADPHPGNFLVVDGPDGPRLALLDFGCVQPYAPARRRAYAGLGLAVLSGDPLRMAEHFAAMGFRSRSGDDAALRAFADLLLQAFRVDTADPLAGLRPEDALARILRLTRDNPIVAVPPDFVLLGRVFATLGGLLVRYRPRVNLFQILLPYLLRAGGEAE